MTPRPRRFRPSRLLLLIAALVLAPGLARSNPDFAAPFLAYPLHTPGGSVAIGDLNGDGHPDLVVASAGSSEISVLLGTGDGRYSSRTDFAATGGGLRGVSLADLNNDGKPDLLYLSGGTDQLVVQQGNGDGTFGAAATYGLPATPWQMAIADLDGDGDPDVAVVCSPASPSQSLVQVNLNDGAGSLSSISATVTLVGHDHSIAVGQFDGGAPLDLVVGVVSSDSLQFLSGAGMGTYARGPTVATTLAPNSLAVSDLDGNGYDDVVVGGDGSSVEVFHQDSSHSFSTGMFPLQVANASIAVAKLGPDPYPDLIACPNAGPPYVVQTLDGDGSGGFLSPGRLFLVGSAPFAFATGDLNSDGRPDVAVLVQGSNTASILLNDGGSLGTALSAAAGSKPVDAAIGDFDGDGLRDLAVADSSGPYRVRILRNTGGGVFVTQGQDTSTFASCSAIAVGDLNRDGHQDLAVATRQSGFGGLDTWLGDGHGGFRFEGDFATGGDSPVSLAVGDLNILPPDLVVTPYLDVAVADDAGCSGTGLVGALFGDGSGGFPGGSPDTYTMGGCPRQVAMADLNSDGNLDLLTADENSSTISVRLGSSMNTGTFPTYTTASVPGGPTCLAVGDLNGDGKPDLAVGIVGSGQIYVLIGAGNGTFGAATPYGDVGYPTPNRIQRIRIADVDGDGKQDVVALDQGPGVLWVFRGNGDGTFSNFPMGYGMDKYPTSFVLGDLDGNGRPDAAVTVRDLDEVEILLNRGGPGVADAPPVVSGPAAAGGEEGGTVTFTVAAQDPDGGPAPSLTADLSALPAGNAASFVTVPPSPCITGVFTWPLKAGEAGTWPVTFTASNSALGSFTTLVHVGAAGISARGSFVWTPGPADVGSYVLTFKARSADGDSSEASTTITVSSGGAAMAPPRIVRADRAPALAMKGPIISAQTTASTYVGQTLVVDVTASDTDSLTASGDGLPTDNTGSFTSDIQPYVAAPASGDVEQGETMTILVTAADPNGDPIDSLTADLSSFPPSGDAAFAAGPGNTSGTFTWTPAASDSGNYGVTFYAKNQLVGTAGTVIHVRRGLLGYWKLNGDGTDAARGNHLTPTGGISYTGGKFGLAANRDASHGTYLSCPATHDFDLTPSGFTFECWEKIRSYSPLGGGLIAAADSGSEWQTWALAVDETGVPFFVVVNDGGLAALASGSAAIADSLYHHYAVTYDGTTLILYIDGAPSGSSTAPGISATVGGGEFRLGAFPFADQAYLEGQTDEVRMWGRARTQQEIVNDMNSELADFPTGVPGDAPRPVDYLRQNAPNPFNPATTIAFSLARAGRVRLRIFDTAGRLVATLIDGQRPTGPQSARWDGRDGRGRQVASGVYYYQLAAPGFVRTRSMVLLK